MNQSVEINELATVLSLLQGEIQDAHKDKKGHNYKYADLSQILDIARPLLHKHGLSIAQMPSPSEPGMVALRTQLMHKSGQWVCSEITMPVEAGRGMSKAQAYGSVITYARRYSLAAMLGITQTDDDASLKPVAEVVSDDLTKSEKASRLSALIDKAQVSDDEILEWCAKGNVPSPWQLKEVTIDYLITMLSKRIGDK